MGAGGSKTIEEVFAALGQVCESSPSFLSHIREFSMPCSAGSTLPRQGRHPRMGAHRTCVQRHVIELLLNAMLRGEITTGNQSRADDLVKLIDTNKDGHLTRAEILAYFSKVRRSSLCGQ